MDITSKELQHAFTRIAKGAEGARDELCAADAKVGDGDLGLTVADGFAACAALSLPSDLGQAFFEASKAFQRASPSSFGTLIATGFMAAAKALKGRDRMALSELAGFLALARDAMLQRGKSSLGDKTVLDGLDAQVKALEEVGSDDPLALAIKAVEDTLERFKGQENRAGRARMFAEKTVGQDDPGQLALLRITQALRFTDAAP
ncbi:dihydroxyacetone kinase subunit L [Rhodospirillum sp. A1_3_36]|uniref:dihydroxyacetone kinase subunit L n=1 Tax=Rhodospirillum sp. A1_3_36 TaxID=3391666 RepID=UPI0039A5329D